MREPIGHSRTRARAHTHTHTHTHTHIVFAGQVDGSAYSVRAERLLGHTGLDWIVFQATLEANDDVDGARRTTALSPSAVAAAGAVATAVAWAARGRW